MTYTFTDIVFIFLIYSFIGWVWETIYCSIKDKQFVYRGFLVGPYCPVYGFAVTTVLIATGPFQNNFFWLFISGLFVATVFEYVAAYFLETFFHMKLWDYSQEIGNIKGRIAPKISLFWGVGILILVQFVQPQIMSLVYRLPNWIAYIITVVMTADFIWTVSDMITFKKAALVFEHRIHEEESKIQKAASAKVNDLAQQADMVSQNLGNIKFHLEQFFKDKGMEPFKFNQRRVLKNYGKIRVSDAPFLTEIRKEVAVLKNKKIKKLKR